MLMDCMSTKLRMPCKEVKEVLCSKAPRNFPSLPLDSVPYYRVYTCSERSDKDEYPLDWTSGTQSRGRRGNGAILRARGLGGGTAAPGLGLSAVLRAGGHASPLYQTCQAAGLLAQRD